MESKGYVEINLGVSNYMRNSPHVPAKDVKDVIIAIPMEGEIPRVREEDHPSPELTPEEAIGRKVKEGLIVFPIELAREHQRMLVYWIQERGEWIGIVESSWLESDAWGDDFSCRGPYALDDYYARRILAIFRIPLSKLRERVTKLSLQQILHTSPDELKQIAEEPGRWVLLKGSSREEGP